MAKKSLHLTIPTEIKYIDTHAHAYPTYYKEELPAVIERAKDKGVAIINIGTHMETSRDCVLTAERFETLHPHMYSIVGIHPSEATENWEADLEALDDLVSKHLYKKGGRGKVIGIGECGIDLFRIEEEKKPAIFALQRNLFRGQIEIALKYDIPLMIHARESYSEILSILDENFIGDKAKLRGNIHFFAGTLDEAMMFLNRGFTLSFTGVITFAASYDEVIRNAPLESIMSETDCPYVAPMPYRGKVNEPSYVTYVVEALAEAKRIDIEECRMAMLTNAERVYGIDLGAKNDMAATV
jgi:TatD DNase family protein